MKTFNVTQQPNWIAVSPPCGPQGIEMILRNYGAIDSVFTFSFTGPIESLGFCGS